MKEQDAADKGSKRRLVGIVSRAVLVRNKLKSKLESIFVKKAR